MLLLIGTSLMCLAVFWFAVLLIGGRNPKPPWWAGDVLVGDVQVPLMMLLAVTAFWYIFRFFTASAASAVSNAVGAAGSAGVAVATVLIIRHMRIGRRLKQFAEIAADGPPEAQLSEEDARMFCLPRKLPWQVRLHLADDKGYNLAWIRNLRCTVRDMPDRSGNLQMLAFDPDQAKALLVVVDGYDTLASHPELVVFSGTFAANGNHVTIETEPPRRAA
jgi:hypothetical protein